MTAHWWNDPKSVGPVVVVSAIVVVTFLVGFGCGRLIHDDLEMSIWDMAAAVGDEFDGHDVIEGHYAGDDWVHDSLAEIDAIIQQFIDYRAQRYGESWRAYSPGCAKRLVERMA